MEKVFLALSAVLLAAFCIHYFCFTQSSTPFSYQYKVTPVSKEYPKIGENVEYTLSTDIAAFYPVTGDLVFINGYIRKVDSINNQRDKVSYLDGNVTCIVNIDLVKPLPGALYGNGFIVPINYSKDRMLKLDWDSDYDRVLNWDDRSKYSKYSF